jgi:hypothetical protein
VIVQSYQILVPQLVYIPRIFRCLMPDVIHDKNLLRSARRGIRTATMLASLAIQIRRTDKQYQSDTLASCKATSSSFNQSTVVGAMTDLISTSAKKDEQFENVKIHSHKTSIRNRCWFQCLFKRMVEQYWLRNSHKLPHTRSVFCHALKCQHSDSSIHGVTLAF